MNIKEFKDRVDKILGRGWDADFTDEDFNNISLVYGYHPMISSTSGKFQIAELFAQGRMGIIHDMAKTAADIADCETTMQSNSVALEKVEKKHEQDQKELLAQVIIQKKLIVDDSNRAYIRLEKIRNAYRS